MYYKISLFCIALYLVLSPYIILPGFGFYDSKRVLQVALFISAGIFAMLSLYKTGSDGEKHFSINQVDTSKPVIALLALLIVSGFVSVLLSDRFEYAFLDYIFFLFLLSIMVVLIPLSFKTHYHLGKVVFITAVLYSVLYLIVFWGNYITSFQDELIPLWPDRLNFSIIIDGIEYSGKEVIYFVHKRFFNHTQTWTLPILMGLMLFFLNRKPKERIIYYLIFILISFWWMLILASGGRGSLIAIIFALIIITVVFGKAVFPFVKQSLGTLFAGGIFYLLFFRFITSDQIPLMRTTDSGRFRMWERATDLWLQEPFFGIGPLHYAQIIDSTPYFSHPHNFYIQFLAEWGFIAFSALVILIYFAGRMVVKKFLQVNRNPANQVIYIAFVWSMAAGLIHASLSGVLHTPISQIWFIMIGAWILGYIRYQESSNSSGLNIQNSARVIFIILLCIVLFIAIPEIAYLSDGYSDYMNKYPQSSFYPRFWEQGLFE